MEPLASSFFLSLPPSLRLSSSFLSFFRVLCRRYAARSGPWIAPAYRSSRTQPVGCFVPCIRFPSLRLSVFLSLSFHSASAALYPDRRCRRRRRRCHHRRRRCRHRGLCFITRLYAGGFAARPFYSNPLAPQPLCDFSSRRPLVSLFFSFSLLLSLPLCRSFFRRFPPPVCLSALHSLSLRLFLSRLRTQIRAQTHT